MCTMVTFAQKYLGRILTSLDLPSSTPEPGQESTGLGVRTSKKKLKAKRQAAKVWLKEQMHRPVAETMRTLASILRGHCNYYGVNGNFRTIQSFWKYKKYSTYRVLNCRHQKRSMKYNTSFCASGTTIMSRSHI